MDGTTQLKALAWEARRRGITYGQLSAALKPGEEDGIYQRYEKWKRDLAQRAAEERKQQKKKRR